MCIDKLLTNYQNKQITGKKNQTNVHKTALKTTCNLLLSLYCYYHYYCNYCRNVYFCDSDFCCKCANVCAPRCSKVFDQIKRGFFVLGVG